MADVEDIIDYIKSLKRGFDKDLFQNKIDELAHAVETVGLHYEDFHTLFKLWLNLKIPITKWTSLGACLVPPDMVEGRTVEYSFRWILANCENESSYSRISFVLDWLTAAMDCECIEMRALDSGYELFYIMLTYEVLTVHAVKLVYTLTKPIDVNRRRVLDLLDYAKKRENKKNMFRQLQVLLGLFKSYKPECVPEDVPAISIHTAFRKVNINLLTRFKRVQERRNILSNERQHLMWINPMNSDRGRNKKAEPLVPNMEFLNIGSKQHSSEEPQKNYLDFSDPVSLLQYSLVRPMSRPARLRALLCNETGLTLLAAASASDHAFLTHDLHHLLTACFLEQSSHSYMEKRDLLQRLAVLQGTLLQGVPIITRFLAQYLPLWNEKDFYAEILDLVEWISVDSPDQVLGIVEPLTRIYHRSQPLEQCAIIRSLSNMYANLAYGSTKRRHHFMDSQPTNYTYSLSHIAGSIVRLSNEAVQVNPEDMRVLHSVLSAATRMARAELQYGVRVRSVPRVLPLAAPLAAAAAAPLNAAAALVMLYQKIFKSMKANNKMENDEACMEQFHTLKTYTCDLISCLYGEEAFRSRKNGLVLDKLHPQLVGKLYSLMPDIDAKFSLRNHIALAPYTYTQLEGVDHKDTDNKLWFDMVIDREFPQLGNFLKMAATELRS